MELCSCKESVQVFKREISGMSYRFIPRILVDLSNSLKFNDIFFGRKNNNTEIVKMPLLLFFFSAKVMAYKYCMHKD